MVVKLQPKTPVPPTVRYEDVYMGSDPEFFFKRDGEVIGAEKVLPKEGLSVHHYGGKFIIDGVQAEFNPYQNSCRGSMGTHFGESWRTLRNHLKANHPGVTCSFDRTIRITKKELTSLDPKNQKFGCAPSQNAYGPYGISADPLSYPYRSAGGHIHLGHLYNPQYNNATDPNYKLYSVMKNNPVRLAKMLDILLGSICVLVDQDEGNIERRKNYGRAGEFRQPKHGFEYRTLSNFWLTNCRLMSFVMGQARLICALAIDERFDHLAHLQSLVKEEHVVSAINNNDRNLAWDNFLCVEEYLKQVLPFGSDQNYPVDGANFTQFKEFLAQDVSYWFDEEPVSHWCGVHDGHDFGFNHWLSYGVMQRKMAKEKKAQATA